MNTENETLSFKQLASRGPVALIEFRGQSVDVINWIDKTTGKAQSAIVHKVAAELPSTGIQVTVELETARGLTNPSDVQQLRAERGEQFLAVLTSYIVNKGSHSCRAKTLIPASQLPAETTNKPATVPPSQK